MKTPKNALASALPVSKKAYAGFVGRIRLVYASDASRSERMIDVLDRYLDGDRDASDTLDEHMHMAFEFLRHDVDLAIERSRRARERACKRRELGTAAGRGSMDPTPATIRPDDDKSMDRATFEKKPDECLTKFVAIVDDEEACGDKEDDKSGEPFRRPLTRRERRARERAARGKSRVKPLCTKVG